MLNNTVLRLNFTNGHNGQQLDGISDSFFFFGRKTKKSEQKKEKKAKQKSRHSFSQVTVYGRVVLYMAGQ